LVQVLQQFDESRFWQRLDALSVATTSPIAKETIDHLKASVRKVANRAAWINSQVCRDMPQYTLHEERHFLNVLGIMDALVPDAILNHMTPLECALPILTAYTHDLGMALSEVEQDKLFDESTEAGKHFARLHGDPVLAFASYCKTSWTLWSCANCG
jgi:hypothetical protein